MPLTYRLQTTHIQTTQELERLEQAFDQVKRRLFQQLHDKLRENLHINVEEHE